MPSEPHPDFFTAWEPSSDLNGDPTNRNRAPVLPSNPSGMCSRAVPRCTRRSGPIPTGRRTRRQCWSRRRDEEGSDPLMPTMRRWETGCGRRGKPA